MLFPKSRGPADAKASRVGHSAHLSEPDDPWGLGRDSEEEASPAGQLVDVHDASGMKQWLTDAPEGHPAGARPARRFGAKSAVAALALAATIAAGVAVFLRTTSQPRVPAVAVGTVIISSHPAGAAVSIDGQPRGVTPVALPMAQGRHTIDIADAVAGSPQHIVADVAGGAEWRRHVVLTPASLSTGALRVETARPGAEVFVDGTSVGRTPVAAADLAVGEHVVEVRTAAGRSSRRVTIEAGATASLLLGDEAPGAPLSAWLTVTAPFEVQVLEQGRLVGVSRSERIMVSAGRHDLDFVNEVLGYRRSRSVVVEPGRTASLTLDIPTASLSVNASPWAEVIVDGLSRGETPLANLRLPLGPHRVNLRHPTLGERAETVVIGLNGVNRLSVDLRK